MVGDKMPLMKKTFRDAFLEALDKPGWTMVRVSALSGVSVEQLKKLKQGKTLSTNVDDAVKIANAFGFTIDEFLEDQTATIRAAVVEEYNRLSESERQFLKAAAKGRDALGHEATD